MPAIRYVDVLIVGAGPAGLMLATCPSRLNVAFAIIDKRFPGELYGQPDDIQPRTLELFESLGLASQFLSKGTHVRRSVKCSYLHRSPIDGEILSQSTFAGPLTFKVRYLIGCDGARSWVRKTMEISIKGDETVFEWGVMNFTPITNLPTSRAKTVIQSPFAPFIGYLPRPNGTARIYTLLGHNEPYRATNTEEKLQASNLIGQATRSGFLPYEMEYKDITWASIYRVKQRVATKYSSQDCIYIAGDACHIHSPLGGQGVNISMADAYNLGDAHSESPAGLAVTDILSILNTEFTEQQALIQGIYIILYGSVKTSLTEELSKLPADMYLRLYVDEVSTVGKSAGIYEMSGVSPKTGGLVLVRPDGHICSLMPVSKEGIGEVREYLTDL
ncbi:hypothetical protein M422DRAFT_248838 [Sphaerobolus stellatus SS14]|nr:hypothetical protein M422DRAFT_248838 [Sphaerobolus stellatus SS14]